MSRRALPLAAASSYICKISIADIERPEPLVLVFGQRQRAQELSLALGKVVAQPCRST